MTTIYLTQWQYQQVLDGMVSTHLDVLDHNHDGKITQLGDSEIAVQHRQTPSIACGSPRHYVYGFTDLVDDEDNPDAFTDVSILGLSHENDQALGYSSADIDFGGALYGYDLETLNKVIDYYNNGGSWNDDDFEEHVYEGLGATGELAPESVTGTPNIDGQMDNPIQNDQLLWNDYVCNSLEDMLSLNGIDESEMADYTTDSQGRISTITLTSGRKLWANYDLSQEGVTASFLTELQAAGATDIKYTADGMIASYTINGTTYNVSSSYGETAGNDEYTQQLLSQVSDKVQTQKLQNEKENNNKEIEKLSGELDENSKEIQNTEDEINKLNDEIEQDIENQQTEVNNFIKTQQSKFEQAVEDAVTEAKNQTVKEGEEPVSFDNFLSSKVSGGKFDISSEVASKIASTSVNSSKISQLNNLTSKISSLNSQNLSLNTQIADLTTQNLEIDEQLGISSQPANSFDFGEFADFDSVNEDIEGFNLKSEELTSFLDETIADFGTKDESFNLFTQSIKESGKIDANKELKKLEAEVK